MEGLNKEQMGAQKEMRIDCEDVSEKIAGFLRDYFKKSGRGKAIVGLSGGIDSAVAAILCTNALGQENTFAVMMPYSDISSLESISNAKLIIERLGLSNIRVDIAEAVNVFIKRKPDQIGLGNIMARVRMIYLYQLARERQGLVIGTCNKSEILLGYFTRYGDGASDIEPIGSLYKTQVYQLAKYLKVPERIIKQPPSAELWKGQTDERELGYSYDFLDALFYLMYDRNMPTRKLIDEYGYKETDIKNIQEGVERNVFKSELPPICEINFLKKGSNPFASILFPADKLFVG